MKIFDGIKDFFLPVDETEDDMPVSSKSQSNTTEETATSSGTYEKATIQSSAAAQPRLNKERPIREREVEIPNSAGRRPNVVNIQATAQLQVVLVKPEVFTDAKQIADHLIAKKTVVLNLESATADNKRRIIDFLVGVAYANGGSLKPVANLTYIITPYNVGFIGEDLVGELESNGVII